MGREEGGKLIKGNVGLGKGQARHITLFLRKDIFYLCESSSKKTKTKKVFQSVGGICWAKRRCDKEQKEEEKKKG